MLTYLPNSYIVETQAKFSITLAFNHGKEDLMKIFGLPAIFFNLGSLYAGSEIRRNAPHMLVPERLDEQYYHARSEEDGWLFLHFSHPSLAGRFILRYDSIVGNGAYDKKRMDFSMYLAERIKRAHLEEHLSDYNAIDALLEEGKKLREKHEEINASFERDMELEEIIA